MSRLDPLVSMTRILTREDGATIAYVQDSAGIPPGVLFLGGFRSDMTGIKAKALAAHCWVRGQPFLRFDYFGHGASSGDFRAGNIGRWREDALAVIDRLTEGPLILVGSSMGGWIALLVALARPDRLAALIGIAAAPDFTEDLIWNRLGDEDRRRLLAEGELLHRSAYEENSIPFTRKLVEEGRQHLLLRGAIGLSCPVRLLHGMKDPDVPYETSLRLSRCFAGTEVVVELVEDGDHRLSRDQDLGRLMAALDGFSARFRPSGSP
jgi:pimeloyl-ACP methyl ester carboxylesterase